MNAAIVNPKGRYCRVTEACSQTNWSRNTLMRIAEEANAIISASRNELIGSSLYLTGIEVSTGKYVENSSCCSMCKRMVINAGIEKVFVRDTKDTFREIPVSKWIEEDESLEGTFGY